MADLSSTLARDLAMLHPSIALDGIEFCRLAATPAFPPTARRS